jgi:hypothetical protein
VVIKILAALLVHLVKETQVAVLRVAFIMVLVEVAVLER